MEKYEKILRSMTFDFFGRGKHKVSVLDHFANDNAVFLDIRSKEEHNAVAFNLKQYMPVLHIPIDELPYRINEVPESKMIGIFCSSSVRSSMVYLYLRANGYENVGILEGGYDSIVKEFKPGNLFKYLLNKK